jgi:acetyltransferase-like isoleucine patch superfamily enzyme
MNPHLEYDWFPGALPANIVLGPNVYIETRYTFARFLSQCSPALVMEEGSGAYDLTTLVTGPRAIIRVGAYTCLNSANLTCEQSITIGAHCLFAWGTVITDSLVPTPADLDSRRAALREAAADPARVLPPLSRVAPVVIEDNVWAGFDAVICGGVRIGRGAIIGSKSVITSDVPPYAIVVGNPPRIVRYLQPDDTDELRRSALADFGLA